MYAKVFTIDPGTDSGIAFVHETGAKPQMITLIGDHHLTLWNTLNDFQPDVIVYERFDHPIKGADLTALEYIGVCKLWSKMHRRPIRQQERAARKWWSNDKLKKLGLYVPGNEARHEMDALRHLLYFITFQMKDNRYVLALGGAQPPAGE